MCSTRPMKCSDLFKINKCNLDPLVETYNIGFYLEYLTRWPMLCQVIENMHGQIEGYILAKTEASPFPPNPSPYDPKTCRNPNYLPWHGHVTALTVAPEFRRQGHARTLTAALERACERENCWFVDLFVRVDNHTAIAMYRKMGYTVYRRVVGYYNDDTDAFDMRKPLSRDKDKLHIRKDGEEFRVEPSDVW
ncbi:acyl-CoA N-acyltransferase [Patellaria atrata CBS 101060]|uniref:Acyl-CoA N-acyltransferase n=1 Tax=Patellaria atrata CBS 101060 TaxID=1346257 RepID=A0A9P4SA71_9PEZI|nr:acyl-CoA N-acyltransferase [Patellaria atrata CBS 101060]